MLDEGDGVEPRGQPIELSRIGGAGDQRRNQLGNRLAIDDGDLAHEIVRSLELRLQELARRLQVVGVGRGPSRRSPPSRSP